MLPPNIPKYIAEIVDFYSLVSTQWRTGGMNGALVGLDYNAIKMVAQVFDFEVTPFRMAVIQEIEHWHIEMQKDR